MIVQHAGGALAPGSCHPAGSVPFGVGTGSSTGNGGSSSASYLQFQPTFRSTDHARKPLPSGPRVKAICGGSSFGIALDVV